MLLPRHFGHVTAQYSPYAARLSLSRWTILNIRNARAAAIHACLEERVMHLACLASKHRQARDERPQLDNMGYAYMKDCVNGSAPTHGYHGVQPEMIKSLCPPWTLERRLDEELCEGRVIFSS